MLNEWRLTCSGGCGSYSIVHTRTRIQTTQLDQNAESSHSRVIDSNTSLSNIQVQLQRIMNPC